MFTISVTHGDILTRSCDLLVLKHASGFYGVDALVAQLIGLTGSVPEGKSHIVSGRKTEARNIAFIGVGPLVEFGYPQIRKFGRNAVFLAAKQVKGARRICMPIHGPGYGLDEAEAFSSLIAGLVDASNDFEVSSGVEFVEIVEINEARARRFQLILQALLNSKKKGTQQAGSDFGHDPIAEDILRTFGDESKLKTRIFVAMPFHDDFNDEWEISIQEAANSLQILCERIDKSAFVGDIAAEIKRRIEQYDGLIALLNGANPNVFLEIGYAWAKSKPTILLAKEGQELPFDVKGQRCIFYKNIADLRTKLKSELGQLKANGVLRRT